MKKIIVSLFFVATLSAAGLFLLLYDQLPIETSLVVQDTVSGDKISQPLKSSSSTASSHSEQIKSTNHENKKNQKDTTPRESGKHWIVANNTAVATWLQQNGFPSEEEHFSYKAMSISQLEKLSATRNIHAKTHLVMRKAMEALKNNEVTSIYGNADGVDVYLNGGFYGRQVMLDTFADIVKFASTNKLGENADISVSAISGEAMKAAAISSALGDHTIEQRLKDIFDSKNEFAPGWYDRFRGKFSPAEFNIVAKFAAEREAKGLGSTIVSPRP